MTGAGVVTRQLEVPDAYRRVALVWRRSFPRAAAVDAPVLQALTDAVCNAARAMVHVD